jgi:hypothetical protein
MAEVGEHEKRDHPHKKCAKMEFIVVDRIVFQI